MKSIVLRPPMRPLIAALILALCSSLGRPVFGQESKWTEEQANKWYSQQPWLVGANFLPSDAINELEMWQAETFDPKEIDREFGWAQAIGMNTMRVFLHNLLWDQDSAGFQRRIDQFLSIAAAHHIRPVLVLSVPAARRQSRRCRRGRRTAQAELSPARRGRAAYSKNGADCRSPANRGKSFQSNWHAC